MERYTGKTYPGGDYLNCDGQVLGRHQGAVGYTIGQRKGLGIALGEPAYVVDKNMAENTVTLGQNEDLFRTTLIADNWNFIPFDTLEEPLQVKARVRYRHTEQPAMVYPMENGAAWVEFAQPQRAITTGQAVVLYDGDLVIGSGTIQKVF
jgi:tRNA-specific 2-thiouridylase